MVTGREPGSAIIARAVLPSPQRRAELMGMVAPTYHTADMVRALPEDGNRYEVVHGELLVTPAPRLLHQLVLERLHLALGNYLERAAVGQLLASPADISWGPDILVQPDLFVVDPAEARAMDWTHLRTLLLVVEVLSPSSVRADRFTKRRLYQEQGVSTYWVVDADARVVEVWTPAMTFPFVAREQVRWDPAGAEGPLVIRLEDLFRPL
jgi:Uma2 family endonuclease